MFFNLGTTTGVDGKGVSDVAGFCPFKDPNVRKAIMLGTDRLSFIKNYMKEDEKAFIASLWPNSYWYNTSLTPYPYDADQANSLLDAAGYPVGSDGIRAGTCDGQPVKFSLGLETTTAQRRIDDMAAIQADLKKVGIDIKPNPIPAGTYFGSYSEGADLQTGKFDMAIYTTGFYPDPDPGDSSCAPVYRARTTRPARTTTTSVIRHWIRCSPTLWRPPTPLAGRRCTIRFSSTCTTIR